MTRKKCKKEEAKQVKRSFVRDSGKIWNQASREIKEATTIGAAKRLIKQYCKTLPI